MPRKINERTLRMKQEYFSLRQSGLGPLEIAAQFGLSFKTVYDSLEEIATTHGVTRESLLKVPQKPHAVSIRRNSTAPKIDLAACDQYFQSTIAGFDKIRAEISAYLSAQVESLTITSTIEEEV